ncbi:TIR domain-containing protein [Chloroflexota bacterium]
MSDVFISHVEEDAGFALEIALGLEEAGYITWSYEVDSLPGPSYLIQTGKAVEESKAVAVVISPDSMSSHQVTKEVVRAHESGKKFIPLLCGTTHIEFQNRQPEWREAIGSATSISIPKEGAASVIPRIISGLQALNIRPNPTSDAARIGRIRKVMSEAGNSLPEKTKEPPARVRQLEPEAITTGVPSIKAEQQARKRKGWFKPAIIASGFVVITVTIILVIISLGRNDTSTTGSSVPASGTLSAQAIELDEVRTGAIEELREVDAWKFTVSAGQIVDIDVEANQADSLDPFLELVEPSGATMAFGEWGGLWGFRLPDSGEYTIKVRSFKGEGTGTYRIEISSGSSTTVQTVTEPASGEAVILPGQTAFGAIKELREGDAWKFTASAGQIVDIDIEANQANSLDPLLELVEPSGATMAFSEWGGLWGLRLPDSGEYTLKVRSFKGEGTGTYRIEISSGSSTAVQTVTEPASGEALIQPGQTAFGTIKELHEVDVWKFKVSADQIVDIDISVNQADSLDPALELIGPAGLTLTFNGDGSISRFSLPDSGEYTLKVKSFQGEGTGTYRIGLSLR